MILVTAFARPTRPVQVPREAPTVMLAIDTSTSMEATDVEPTRLEAAKASAASFADGMPDRFRLGLVAFDSDARQVVAPTQDHASVRNAIERLRLDNYTAIGEAIFTSLDSLQDVPSRTSNRRLAHIVLMSDGDTNSGRSNESAARAALTTSGSGDHDRLRNRRRHDRLGQRRVQRPRQPRRAARDRRHHEGTLLRGTSADELSAVYDDIGSSVGFRTEQREVTAWFVGIGLVLVIAGAGASLIWMSRLP